MGENDGVTGDRVITVKGQRESGHEDWIPRNANYTGIREFERRVLDYTSKERNRSGGRADYFGSRVRDLSGPREIGVDRLGSEKFERVLVPKRELEIFSDDVM